MRTKLKFLCVILILLLTSASVKAQADIQALAFNSLFPNPISPGNSPTNISWRFANNGPGAPDSVLTEFYLSRDAVFGNGDDIRLGQYNYYRFDPFYPGTYSVTLSTTNPAGFSFLVVPPNASDNYYVFVRVSSPLLDPITSNNLVRSTNTVTVGGSTCTFANNPVFASFPSGGGSTTVGISASASTCNWNVINPCGSWLTASPTNGMGNGSVTISAGANSTCSARTCTVIIAGQSFRIDQTAGSPPFSITPLGWSAPAVGSTTTVSITAESGDCNWTVSGLCSNWLSATVTSGSGNGSVTLSARPNTTCSPRSCTLTIAGEGFTINQAATAGTFAINPRNWSPSADGGSAILNIVASADDCPWTVSNLCSSWMMLTPTNGVGNGVVTVSATANPTSVIRICRDLRIAGQAFNVTQAPSTVLQFSKAVYTNSEASRKAVLRIIRSGPANKSVTVDYFTQNGTAASSSDYRAWTGRVMLKPGILATNISIVVTNDTRAEGIENFQVFLANPIGAVLGNPSVATVLITDDDRGGVLNFSATNYVVSETGRLARITITRTGGSASDVTAEFATADSTATGGLDYSNILRVVSFKANQTNKVINVPIINDRFDEPTETVLLRLRNPTGGARLGGQSNAILRIRDDDPSRARIAESLSGQSVNATRIQFDRILRLPGGLLQLQVSCERSSLVRIEASSDLSDWVSIAELTNSTGVLQCIETNLTGGRRFYRAVLLNKP